MSGSELNEDVATKLAAAAETYGLESDKDTRYCHPASGRMLFFPFVVC